MQVPYRQGVISFDQAGSGPQFLRRSTGGTTYVDLITNGVNVVASVANGQSDYAIVEPISVLRAWGPLQPSTNYWLYWDIDNLTGNRTFGQTLILPTFGLIAPTKPVIDQHWFDTTLYTMRVFNGSSWSAKIRVFAGNIESNRIIPYGANSQAGLNGHTALGKIIFDGLGKPIRKKTGEFFTTEDSFMVAGAIGQVLRMEYGVAHAQAETTIPRYSVVKYSYFDKVTLAGYNDIGVTPLAIVTSDLNTGDVANIIFSGVVSNLSWDWRSVNAPLWISNTGQLVTTPPSTSSTIKPPVARVVGRQSIMFGMVGSTEATAPPPVVPPASAPVNIVTYVTGEAIGGHRVVMLNAGKIYYADNQTINTAQRVLGLTIGAANAGVEIQVQISGELAEPSWNWDLNYPIYLAQNGQLTQIVPEVPAKFLLLVGLPITRTKIFISIREPIALHSGV